MKLIRIIISIALLTLLSPIFFIFFIIIMIDDGFPIFFRQKRIGQNNTLFWIYKFRTMKKNTPDIPTHLLQESDLLFTRLGKHLRKFSIDELPQLINIIKGDMAFIGPRPALYNQTDLIQLRKKVNAHTLLPGVTGWAQVNGRDDLSIDQKVRMDKYYLNNKSLVLNIKILFLTVIKVLFRAGITH